MKRWFVIPILFLLITWNCDGQNNSLLDSAFIFSRDGKSSAAEKLFHESIRKASTLPSIIRDSIQCRAYFSLGIEKHDQRDFKSAIAFYRKASMRCKASADSLKQYYSAINLSRCYAHLLRIDSALVYLKNAQLLLDTTDAISHGEYYKSIGWIFQKARITEESAVAYRRAAEIFEEDSLYSLQLQALYDVALTYDDDQNYEKVLEVLSECREVNKIIRDTFYSWLIGACKGITEVNTGKYEEAYSTLRSALEIGKRYDKNLCCGNRVFYALAVLKNNRNENVDSILSIAKGNLNELTDQRDIRNIYKGLYLCYDEMREYDKALKYHELFTEAADSVRKEDYSRQLAMMQYQENFRSLKAQLKDARINLEQTSIGYRRSVIVAFLLLLVTVALVFILLKWRKYRNSYSYDLARWNKIVKDTTSDSPDETLIIKQAKKYVKENLQSDNLSGKSIARELNINVRSFNDLLKRELNLTSAQFINTIRIREAQNLLLDESRTISQVAYDVGFSDPAYFSRIFKKVVKQSPTEWRDQQFKKHTHS